MSRPQRIAVIVNPHAREHRRSHALAQAIRDEAGTRASVHATASVTELSDLCRTLAAAETELVVISGGDGSLMAGVTALADAYGERHLPRVAAIGGGTAATIARNWGVDPRPLPSLRRLLSRPRRVVRRPSLRIEDDASPRRIGFIVGTGLVASFFDEYYRRGAPGYRGAAQIVGRVFAESFVGGPLATQILDPMACELWIDGARAAPDAWSLVCAAAVPNLGLKMRVTYRAGDDDHRLHLVASPLPPGRLGPRAPYVLAGRSIGGPGHVDQLVRRFTLRFPGVGRYVLDGELLSAHEVTVTPGPKLDVVLPT